MISRWSCKTEVHANLFRYLQLLPALTRSSEWERLGLVFHFWRNRVEAIFEIIFGAIVGIFGYLFYGTEDRPRHVAWRIGLRAIAFVGAIGTIAALLFPVLAFVPVHLWFLWAIVFFSVLVIEFEIGNRTVGIFLSILAALMFCALAYSATLATAA